LALQGARAAAEDALADADAERRSSALAARTFDMLQRCRAAVALESGDARAALDALGGMGGVRIAPRTRALALEAAALIGDVDGAARELAVLGEGRRVPFVGALAARGR